MAIVFELVVNFDGNSQGAERAMNMARMHAPLPVGGQRAFELLEPSIYEVRGFYVVSIAPAGVGYGVPRDQSKTRRELTAGELTELAHGLYRLLAQFDGYRAATVDWDPEGVVECADLEEDYGDQLVEGYPHGLVLAEGVRRGLSADAARHFEPFSPGFDWIPYRGHQSGTY